MSYKRTSPIPIVEGGTDLQTFTTYAPVLGGTTATGPLQQATTGFATSGFVLTSTGNASVPTWQATTLPLLTFTAVNHAASPYTVLAADEFLKVDSTAGAVTILLPNAPSTGRMIIIKDTTGTTGTNAMTVTTVGGSVTIDTLTSQSINTAFQSMNVTFDGTGYEIY